MKMIVNFTPTGMIPTKEMTPHVPVTVNEIVDDVLQANEIGITTVHLHARDPLLHTPTSDPLVYQEIICGIRKYAPDLAICVSTSGRHENGFNVRSQVLQLKSNVKPDMASLTLGSLNFNREVSINDPETIKQLAQEMIDKNIKPELEIFDIGMVNYIKYIIGKKLLTPPLYVNLILGNVACAQVTPLHIGIILSELPDCLWSIGGVGDFQLMANSLSIAIGGGVRVGLEDNIWYDQGRTKLATNAELLKRIHVIAKANGREIMTPIEFRKKMKLCN